MLRAALAARRALPAAKRLLSTAAPTYRGGLPTFINLALASPCHALDGARSPYADHYSEAEHEMFLRANETDERDDDGAETAAAPPRGEDDARAEDVTSPRFMRTRADAKVVPRGETPKRSEAAGAFLCGNQPLGRDIPEFRQNFDSMFRSTPAPRCAQGNCTLKAP